MTLQDIRAEVVEQSGRYDLRGGRADFFINAGQRFLDGLTDFPGSRRVFQTELEKGNPNVDLGSCKVVDEVRLVTSDGDLRLRRLRVTEHFDKYVEQKEAKPVDFTTYVTREDSVVKYLRVGPVPDSDYTLKIRGKFPSGELKNQSDQSFWSIEYPETLIQATLYQLEKFYRNSQGTQDHLQALMQDVQGIQHDMAEDESRLRDNMENSW